MSWYDWSGACPTPHEVVVHKRSKPTVPFGFQKGTGINWRPGPTRRVRDEQTVDWAQRIRKETDK